MMFICNLQKCLQLKKKINCIRRSYLISYNNLLKTFSNPRISFCHIFLNQLQQEEHLAFDFAFRFYVFLSFFQAILQEILCGIQFSLMQATLRVCVCACLGLCVCVCVCLLRVPNLIYYSKPTTPFSLSICRFGPPRLPPSFGPLFFLRLLPIAW